MKKIICILLLLCGLSSGARAQIIGAGYATDIHAYIDYLMVPSYNIDGYTAVIVRDLENFGFVVNWDESTKTVSFYKDFIKPLTPMVPEYEEVEVGTKLFDVYKTDIRTFFRGKEIPSYNIGGRTAVRLRDIAIAGEAQFDDKTKSADVFSLEAEYFEDEISYIRTNVYGSLLFLSKADKALSPLVKMLESGRYQSETVEAYRTFYDEFTRMMEAFKVFKEPYGFSASAQELWWAMVNMHYAGETALLLADAVGRGADITEGMGYYRQYTEDSMTQRRLALVRLDEEMRVLTFFWG